MTQTEDYSRRLDGGRLDLQVTHRALHRLPAHAIAWIAVRKTVALVAGVRLQLCLQGAIDHVLQRTVSPFEHYHSLSRVESTSRAV